ncbi:hypothetical protein KSF73_05230 [Burkholderiaceae bacterium DAT-1]|nr:hypothetical protein [Burkholderiaceae bacterium DAT-1]
MARRLRTDTRITLLMLCGMTLPLGIACVSIWTQPWSVYARLLLLALLVSLSFISVFAVRHHYAYPLRNLANLVESIRVGDYSMRLNLPQEDALGELARDINALASTLQSQRLQTDAAHRLVDRIVAGMDIAILAFNPDGCLKLANPAAARLMKLPDNASAFTARDLQVSDWMEDQPERIVERAFPGGSGSWRVRRDSYLVDGSTHTLLLITDMRAVLRDEEQKAWRRLIRVFSHEVNNSLGPIASVGNTLSALLKRDGLHTHQDDIAEGLAIIEDRARHLSEFVRRYAELARLPEPAKCMFDLSARVRQLLPLFTGTTLISAPDQCLLFGDPAQIEQVLVNLFKNASEAGASQIDIRIQTSPPRILIQDNGTGIVNPHNLFVPFYTTKPSGTGIGLVLCRQIMAAHQGDLVLRNREDQPGSEAILTFRHLIDLPHA